MKSTVYISGINASPGIAIGSAFVLSQHKVGRTGILLRDENAINTEVNRFHNAVAKALAEIDALKRSTSDAGESIALEILETQVELVDDPQVKADVIEKIQNDGINASDALLDVTDAIVAMFEEMDDEYMRSRAIDIRDASNRILRNLGTTSKQGINVYQDNTIVIAHEISPSDTFAMTGNQVTAFATRSGGRTSHAAIIAKARNLPAVLACGEALDNIQTGDQIIVDGTTGMVIVHPDEICLSDYRTRLTTQKMMAARLFQMANVHASTTDGVRIHLLANVASAADMSNSIQYGAEGSGLFRTELLFMDREYLPNEEEQFEYYKKVVVAAGELPVVIRTIDIGGDKPLPYLNLVAEQNPFLGYRAIRICLDRKDIFVTQLRAILRASAFGTLKIMFPMISGLQELRDAKEVLRSVKEALDHDGILYDKNIQTGIMIEIPSAAITADLLAKESDFFSIGTNDLCQYTLAVDRMNEKISSLYEPFNPGVLRLIANVIFEADKRGIPVGMCGEFASDSDATILLLGLGLREFSMSAASIPAIKNVIINTSIKRAQEIAREAMAIDNPLDIRKFLKQSQ